MKINVVREDCYYWLVDTNCNGRVVDLPDHIINKMRIMQHEYEELQDDINKIIDDQ